MAIGGVSGAPISHVHTSARSYSTAGSDLTLLKTKSVANIRCELSRSTTLILRRKKALVSRVPTLECLCYNSASCLIVFFRYSSCFFPCVCADRFSHIDVNILYLGMAKTENDKSTALFVFFYWPTPHGLFYHFFFYSATSHLDTALLYYSLSIPLN